VNDSHSLALTTPEVCGPVEFKLELLDPADGVTRLLSPTWVTFDLSAADYVVIDGATSIDIGTHQFTLTAFLRDHAAVELTMGAWLTVNVLCEIQTLAVASNPIPTSFDYTIGSKNEFEVPTYTVSPDPACAHTLDFHLEIDGDPTAEVPDFITLDSSGSLSIYGTDNSEALKSYSVRVVAEELESGVWNSDVLFTVNTGVNCFGESVLDPEGGFSLTQELNYEIGSLPKTFKFDTDFRDSLSALHAGSNLCEVEFALHLLDGSTLKPLPDFVKFDISAENQISVETEDLEVIGTHLLSLTIWLKDEPTKIEQRDFLTVTIDCVVETVQFVKLNFESPLQYTIE